MEQNRECENCQKSCFLKEEGKLKPRDCYLRRYLRSVYSDLLVGPPPTKAQSRAILSEDIQNNSMIYYPYSQGRLRAAALILMRLKITTFKVFHTHLLVDVYVSKSEEYESFSSMYSPFFLLLHGFVETPNVRLMDLIREFLDYRMVDKIPFLLFTVAPPDPLLVNYFKERNLLYKEIYTQERREAKLF